ncbi:class I SAM-dependent methyltransferase [Mycetocola sp.]|uniref:class I SAM-dependent methyltransferase n=1 Tax=Mycetocola sp. TaxID=1871042 RepID=UPI003989393D
MHTENAVALHYRNPALETSILEALRRTGHDPERIGPDDLLAVDQFHIGGVQAARDLALGAGIGPTTVVLDIGSGLGGPARLFAHHFGATVVGVDLTPEFVETATSLTRRSGLSDRVRFVQGNALELPFTENEFDVATLLHVGMNIADKSALFRSAARVLKPGGMFAVYDVMRTGDGQLAYPLPWATSAEISFSATPEEYATALQAAGFTVGSTRNLRLEGLYFAWS